MAEMILHHYSTSTFSERVRLALGLKGLDYRSVDIPAAMPKPDLSPLTGGYRRTPVLQIGADIYCDTLLILQTIETLHPEPPVYPEDNAGFARALVWWADKTIFPAALGAVAVTVGHEIPAEFVAERKAFGFPLAPEDVEPHRHRYIQQGAAHFGWAAEALSDGRRFLAGDHPTIVDFALYSPLWLLKHQGGPEAETMLPLAPFVEWYRRVEAIGHGRPVETSAKKALDIARDARPVASRLTANGDPSGLEAGSRIVVTADDTGRNPVEGTLVASDAQEIVMRIRNERVGEIALHFPRAGFDVVSAQGGEP